MSRSLFLDERCHIHHIVVAAVLLTVVGCRRKYTHRHATAPSIETKLVDVAWTHRTQRNPDHQTCVAIANEHQHAARHGTRLVALSAIIILYTINEIYIYIRCISLTHTIHHHSPLYFLNYADVIRDTYL